jgi:hypothetical protein
MRGNVRVGRLSLAGHTMDEDDSNANFLDTMDSESAEACEVAEVLTSEWDDLAVDVAMFGEIVEFSNAWTIAEAKLPPGLWADLSERLIQKAFPSHSILMMKAFPLEYVGVSGPDSAASHGLGLRQAAMIRHYERLFGVRRFSDWAGRLGWLWRPNADFSGFIIGRDVD